ncbi:TonB-dependent siderophore receptor [Paraburkholderia sp. BCC1885]|uniref:TonB-dependent siderophore receptor n=1 Tax=Paraburkholderia sp. BCC1885 TaxID=2562669 RepID=UPI001183407A|nr:TonB-dependent receptor [Paraburkholderia sp. BCC1885]
MKIFGGSNWNRASLGLALLVACQVPLICQSAYAQSPATAPMATLSYDIPAGPLDKVLVAVASVSRHPISFDPTLTSNYKGGAVKGNLTVEQAVDRALAGTGLERATTPDGALTVRAKATAAAAGVAAAPTPDGAQMAVLPQINVTDTSAKESVTTYTAANSSSATLTDTPTSETPMAVQTVTQAVMRSQQATSVADALRNVSGVSIDPGQAAQSTIILRGFAAPVSTDGLVTNNANGTGYQNGLDIPLIGVERIDVVKGADSIISGGTNPGGAVNVVRKQPQADPVYEFETQVGSYGDVLIGGDAGGAISKDNNLNYRFIVNGERTGESYGGTVGSRNLYIAPSIGYQTADTNFVVGFEQNTQHQPLPYYTVFLDGEPAPITHAFGDENDHIRTNSSTVYYDFSQRLSSAWSVKSKASYNATVTSFYYTEGSVLDDLGDALFLPVSSSAHQRAWSLQESLEGKFHTGPISHDLVVGFNYQRSITTTAAGVDLTGIFPGSIFTSTPPEDAVPTGNGGTAAQFGYSNQFYLQDQLKYERFHLLASISHGQSWSNTSTSSSTSSAWSPNVGALYQLTGDIAAYASYQKTFTPLGQVVLVGGAAPPAAEQGKNVEVGLKGNFLDDRVTASVALYRAAQTNVALQDGALPGFSLIDPAGYVTKGVELDISGQITNGLKIIANYTYNAQQNPASSSFLEAAQEARHKASLWMEYAFQSSALQGFGLSGGITARSSYQAGQTILTNPIVRVPGQAITDASVFYRSKKWTTTFGVKNIFNRLQYDANGEDEFLDILPGRTFVLTSIYQF